MTIGGMVSWIFLDKLMYEDAFFLFVLMNKVNPFVLIICTYVQNIDFDLLLFQAWDNHLKRNQSVVVDLFQGQVKNSIISLYCDFPFFACRTALHIASKCDFELSLNMKYFSFVSDQ